MGKRKENKDTKIHFQYVKVPLCSFVRVPISQHNTFNIQYGGECLLPRIANKQLIGLEMLPRIANKQIIRLEISMNDANIMQRF